MSLRRFRWSLLPSLLCMLLLWTSACAISSGGKPLAAPAGPPVPLLWKVSGPAGQQLYLLGSFHLLSARDYPLAKEVDAAFAASGSLMFELSPTELTSPELGLQMAQAAKRQDGTRLQDELDPATWHKLQSYAGANGLPLEALQGFKAWYVGLSISITEMGRQGLGADAGLDRHFMQLALEHRKPCEGLERAADQIAMLTGMTPVEQHQMLAESLDDAAADDSQTQQLHDAWRRGDVATLWSQMGVEMKRQYPALYQRIDVERNNRWLPVLERRLHGTGAPTLVVVGALHLLGPDGLVEKLKAKGYKVERICAACTPAAAGH